MSSLNSQYDVKPPWPISAQIQMDTDNVAVPMRQFAHLQLKQCFSFATGCSWAIGDCDVGRDAGQFARLDDSY